MAIALPKNPLPLGDRVSRGFASQDSASLPFTSGLPSLDEEFGGIPAGVIAEIVGGVSSGVTSLALRYLAEATSQGQIAAWIDPHEAFDVPSAIDAGVQLQQLLWVRCHRDIDRAQRVTDLILHGGGFGLVVFDLIGTPQKALESFPLSWWFRFQRAIRNTPTALIVLANSYQAKSAAGRQMQVQREKVVWSGTDASRLLDGFVVQVAQRKPMHGGFVSLPTEATIAEDAVVRRWDRNSLAGPVQLRTPPLSPSYLYPSRAVDRLPLLRDFHRRDHPLESDKTVAAQNKITDKVPVEGSIGPNADPSTATVWRNEEQLTTSQPFDVDRIEPERNRRSPVDALECHKRFPAS